MAGSCAFGQNHYFFSKFTANDGLPATKVYYSFQDSRGYIWISTNSGLCKYDGKKFINYNLLNGLKSNIIFNLSEDNHNRIWVSTDNGQSIFDGKKFTNIEGYQYGTKDFEFIGDTGFLATADGVLKYYNTTIVDTIQIPFENQYLRFSTLHSKGSKVYLGTNKGIYTYEQGIIKPFWVTESPEYVLSITEASNGEIWFCTLGGKVFYKRNGAFHKLENKEEGRHNTYKLLSNQDGDMMLIHGLYISVYRNEKLHYYIDNFIEDNENVVTDVMQDREGNLWISTVYGIIVGRKTQISKITFPRSSIPFMFVSDFTNELYAVGNKNIYILRNDTIYKEVFKDKPDQLGEHQFVNEYRKGEFLFGSTLGGVIQYKDGKYKSLTKGFVMMRSVLRKGDEILLNSKREVFRLVNDSLIPYTFDLGELRPLFSELQSLNEKENLVATNKGILRFSEEDYRLFPVYEEGSIQPFVKKIIKVKDNSLFLSTKGHGLINVSLKRDSLIINYEINSGNSIINDDVIDFVIDRNNNLWLTTSDGLYRITNVNTSNQMVEHFGVEDGMPPHSWSFSSLLSDKNGFVYLSGSEGVTKFPLDINNQSNVVQTTHITHIEVNGDDFVWELDDSLLNFDGIPSEYSFQYMQNAVTFHLAGMNFYKPQKIVYQYKLEGMESNWTTSSNSFVSYNNLSPGSYTFKVRSGTSHLNVEEGPITTFRFDITPPFWKTWWFSSLLALGLLFLVYAFYRYRLNEQYKKQQIKLEADKLLNESKMMAFQARMNPHFVFNSLNSIQYFITKNDKVSTLTYLSKFARLLRQIVDNSVQTKISLDIEIEMLKAYIEMEELRFDKRFTFEIKVDKDLEPGNIEIPGMILQPFVENAILHGLLHKKENDGKLSISFRKDVNQIICIIEDNGIGRERSEQLNKMKHRNHQSQGTKIAMNRLEMLNNKEEGIFNKVEFIDLIKDSNPMGTRVVVVIPIL